MASNRKRGSKGSMNDYRFQVRRSAEHRSREFPISGDFTARTGQSAASWQPMTYNYPQDAMESDWGGSTGSSLMVIGTAVAAIAVIAYLVSRGSPSEVSSNML